MVQNEALAPAIEIPKIDFTWGDILHGIGEAARDHRGHIFGAISVAALGALAVDVGTAVAQGTTPPEAKLVDWPVLLIGAYSILKNPFIFGYGGALRIKERRRDEHKNITARLKMFSDQLNNMDRQSSGGLINALRGLAGDGENSDQRQKVEASVQYLAGQAKNYEKNRLGTWTAKETWREFGEGVILGFAMDGSPLIMLYLLQQFRKLTEMLNNIKDPSELVTQVALLAGTSIGAAVGYTFLIRQFFKIQAPGGKTGAEEDARSENN